MSLHALRKGHSVTIGTAVFLIIQRLPEGGWQLQNTATGEWHTFDEDSLLDQFAAGELSFVSAADHGTAPKNGLPENLTRDLSAYPPDLLALAGNRVQYLKEIDRQQPISITRARIEPLTREVSDRIKDGKPPGWRTVCRDYRKWLAAGRDTRVEIHLSDVDSSKRGQADKRCLIEVRPKGARPLSASAQATKMAYAVSHALGKMQRSLTTFYGRRGRPAAAVSSPSSRGEKAVAMTATLGTKIVARVKKVAVEKPTKLSPRGPKKKGIYQARRKSWPTRT